MKMKALLAGMVLMLGMAGTTALAQVSSGARAEDIPFAEIPVTFDYLHTDVALVQNGGFSMYGGGAGVIFNLNRKWGLEIAMPVEQASNIYHTNATLLFYNYQIGARYAYRTHSRYTPFAHALIGGQRVSSNYEYYYQGHNYMQTTLGGGVQAKFSKHISFNLVQADWNYVGVLNTSDNNANNLHLSTGIVFNLGRK